jgi:hypothetical protein
MYTIKKIDGLYRVITESGMVQFSSACRANCKDWIKLNEKELA